MRLDELPMLDERVELVLEVVDERLLPIRAWASPTALMVNAARVSMTIADFFMDLRIGTSFQKELSLKMG
jgi:hypothetical protein